MLTARVRDSLLTLLGIAGLIVYVLACRPSYSPDGRKIILPVIDAKNKTASVVLYDLEKRSAETIFVSGPAWRDEQSAYSVQWLPDGKRVVLNGVSVMMVLPVGSSDPIRYLPLEEDVELNSLEIPAPVIGKHQFLLAKKSVQEKNEKGATVSVEKPVLLRVDLESLAVRSVPIDIDGNLVGNGVQLFYVAKLEGGDKDVYEVGSLEPDKLSRTPLLQLRDQDSGEPTGFAAPTRSGRLALMTKLGEAQRVLLIQGNAVERTIPVAAEDSGIRIGNAEWSADEKTLYLAYTKTAGKDEPGQFGVMEVPVGGGPIRATPLFTATVDKDDSLVLFQIALSPDGRQIAATSACLGEENGVKAQDRALYLVDLGNVKRNVTRIVLPAPSAAGSPTGNK